MQGRRLPLGALGEQAQGSIATALAPERPAPAAGWLAAGWRGEVGATQVGFFQVGQVEPGAVTQVGAGEIGAALCPCGREVEGCAGRALGAGSAWRRARAQAAAGDDADVVDVVGGLGQAGAEQVAQRRKVYRDTPQAGRKPP